MKKVILNRLFYMFLVGLCLLNSSEFSLAMKYNEEIGQKGKKVQKNNVASKKDEKNEGDGKKSAVEVEAKNFEELFVDQFEMRKVREMNLPTFLASNIFSLKLLLKFIEERAVVQNKSSQVKILEKAIERSLQVLAIILNNEASKKNKKNDGKQKKNETKIALGKCSGFVNQIESMVKSYAGAQKKGSIINRLKKMPGKISKVTEKLLKKESQKSLTTSQVFFSSGSLLDSIVESLQGLCVKIAELKKEIRIWDDLSRKQNEKIRTQNVSRITIIRGIASYLKDEIKNCKKQEEKKFDGKLSTFPCLVTLYKDLAGKIVDEAALVSMLGDFKRYYQGLFVSIDKDLIKLFLKGNKELDFMAIKEEVIQEVLRAIDPVSGLGSAKARKPIEQRVRAIIGKKITFIYKNPYLLFGDRYLSRDSLKEYVMSLEVLERALQMLETGELDRLDPAGGDNACQVRAAKTLDLYESMRDEKKYIYDNLKKIKDILRDSVVKGGEDFENYTSLASYLNAKRMFISLNDDSKYLICCYFRCFGKNGAEIKDILRRYEQGSAEQSKMLRELLMDYAVTYLQKTSERNKGIIVKQVIAEDQRVPGFDAKSNKEKQKRQAYAAIARRINQLAKKSVTQGQEAVKKEGQEAAKKEAKEMQTIAVELAEGLKQVAGTDGKRSCPNFFGVITLLYQELLKGRPICVKVTKVFAAGKVECVYFYRPNRAKTNFELFTPMLGSANDLGLDTPIMVFEGWAFDGTYNEFCKMMLGKNDSNYIYNDARDYGKVKDAIKNYPLLSESCVREDAECLIQFKNSFEKGNLLKDILLPNEAQHTQFPGKKGSLLKVDFTGCPQLKKLYEACIKESKKGASRDNMGIYLIDHIYPTTIKYLRLGAKFN